MHCPNAIMLVRRARLPASLLLIAACCFLPVRPTPPPDAPASEVALAGAAVLIGAGDIGACNSTGDERTAALIDSVLRADRAAGVEDAVFTVGDNAYPSGREQDFARCFAPSWGDTAKLIMQRIRPTPGNHEYRSERAMPFFRYFGARAGEAGKGYYSFELGEWHVIALNSEIVVNRAHSNADRAAQEDWLREDLAEHAGRCTVAFFHRPRFSSGLHGGDPRMRRLWEILYEAGVELVINGHDHLYERFAPLTPAGVIDTVSGLTQIIVGTGGAPLRSVRDRFARHSVSRIQGHFGVLKLTLGDGAYRHAFLDTDGRIWDTGGGSCH